MKKITSIAILSLLLLVLHACSSMSLESKLNDGSITIDGESNGWQGSLYKLDDTNMGIGVKNDNENIYLCLVSGDRNVNRQIMMNGLYIWFDEKGKTKKRIGIKYPIGNTPPDFRQTQKTHRQFGENQIPTIISPEFEFYVNDDDKIICPNHQNIKGIDLEFSNGSDKMIYEIKVPYSAILNTITPDAIEKIGIGVEIAAAEKPEMSGGPDGNMSGGSGGGMRGGPSGGMGGGMGGPPGGMSGGPSGGGMGMEQESSSTVKKWLKVELTKE